MTKRATKITILFLFIFTLHGKTQNSAVEAWRSLLDKPELANYFSGMFESLGITIQETGEQLTVLHKVNHFEIIAGLDSTHVDFNIELRLENVVRMQQHGKDGKINADESFRIMSVLFTPLTVSALSNPIFSKAWKQQLFGIENLAHVYLHNEGDSAVASHTLIYINKAWLVIPGIQGTAKRIFNMNADQAIAYQRHVFLAQQSNTKKSWRTFGKWYLEWRKSVSVKLK